MTKNDLAALIKSKKSFLCIGLDTDLTKLPKHISTDAEGILAFNLSLIEATLPFAVAYKINSAFYEALGPVGWDLMQKTIAAIPPQSAFVILDAKRGDIGNTSNQYALSAFDVLAADAVTISPYMGFDSVEPFFAHKGKWSIILALTSNAGSQDFQMLKLENGNYLFEEVLSRFGIPESENNTMFVVGATQTTLVEQVRKIVPKHFLLIPGVGTQGGDLQAIASKTLTSEGGILVNVSRAIIYAGSGEDYIQKAVEVAQSYQQEMETILQVKFS